MFNNTEGTLLVYDCSNIESFELLNKWSSSINTTVKDNSIKYLICNKIDKPDRTIFEEEGKQMADKIGFKYFETSAWTGDGIKNLHENLVEDLLKTKATSPVKLPDSIKLKDKEKPKSGEK